MKRRIRFMSAILSLAASMAVLVFGVYAAGDPRTGTISSSVSFTGDYVYATVVIYSGVFSAAGGSSTTYGTAKKTMTFNSGDVSDEVSLTGNKYTEANRYYSVKIVITNTQTTVPFTYTALDKAALADANNKALNNNSTPAAISRITYSQSGTFSGTLNATTATQTLYYNYYLNDAYTDLTTQALKNITVILTRN